MIITPPTAFYDTECYPNYWLLKFRVVGGPTYSYSIVDDQRFTQRQLGEMMWLFANYRTVSFYGNGYDVPMLRGVWRGMGCSDLKMLNDKLIVEGVKPWDMNLGEWVPVDHVDIMEVLPGKGSQNQYAGRIHYKMMQDLPYDPAETLTDAGIAAIDGKCEGDLGKLEALFHAVAPQIKQRERLGARYGLDLRSKSDAQVAEAVLRKRCEQATGRRVFKPQINWALNFRYNVPSFIAFSSPQLQRALELVKSAVFTINPPLSMRHQDDDDAEVGGKCIGMPAQLEGLEIVIGSSTYKMGVGGLHSQEKRLVAVSDAAHVIRMPDVASYYPNLIINSGAWPSALGSAFILEYTSIKNERIVDKATVKALKAAGLTHTVEYDDAKVGDDGGKIMINGTFGKTGSPYSVLFAPEMLIQTTLTGQLSLLMLIEWMEAYGIPVISANTDGIVLKCPRDKIALSDQLIAEWERRTGLEMEIDDYVAIYARDVNSYFAIKTPDDVKRKGEYAVGGLVEKKNPDCEICSDAVAAFLAKGVPIAQTIGECRDIRKFVKIQKVAGGGVKMWGHGPRRGELVRDMVPTLIAHGWTKVGTKWARGEFTMKATDAYQTCFEPRRPEMLGKVVRWCYGTNAPGPIIYSSNGNTVGGSYGAQPCMVLPDEFPADIDYAWYINAAEGMLRDVGYYVLSA